MPVQINEMIIRANITESAVPEKKGGNAPAAPAAVNKDEIVRECAALVLEMLNDKKQR
ncbi:DUF5908 family protein [Adhaeribacter arboris]|uniref:DUF5908 family protein n=1 Tax=Adhaeribacter arboris TaxID=2072846 RepID=UPI001304E4DD|nr:DUF5908 family protein [Adhaeribacter arboris]